MLYHFLTIITIYIVALPEPFINAPIERQEHRMKYGMRRGWQIGLVGWALGLGVADAQTVVRRIDQPPLAA